MWHQRQARLPLRGPEGRRRPWRVGLLPKEYEFVHEFGKSLVHSDKKRVTCAALLVTGIIFHPVVFVSVWGKDGLLGIHPFDSAVVSAVLLLVLETIIFAIVLLARVLGIPPREPTGKVIMLQPVVHVVLGL
jgi:hypothetical protein